MTGREPGSAEFEPTPLTPRRRRVDPAVIGALVVVAGIGLAVLKPWVSPVPESQAARATPPGSGAIGDVATAVPAPSRSSAPAVIDSTPPIPWSIASEALEPHDAWGVRAIVRGRETGSGTPGDGPGAGLVERWTELETATGGMETALLSTADQGVLALGLTFPPDELPVDVRIFRETERGWQWLDAEPIGVSPAVGAFLFAPPRIGGVVRSTWPTGAYRIEVLEGDTVRTIDVDLPDRFEVVPQAGFIPDEMRTGLVSPFAPELGSTGRRGPFLVDAGRTVWLDAMGTEALEPAEAWLSTQLVPGGIERQSVVAVHAPRANGFGYLFAADATDLSVELARLQPEGSPGDVRRADGARFAGDDRLPFVILRAPAGEPWLPGTYRMDVGWRDADGAHHTSVHVELRPGPFGTQPMILGSLRRLAPAAGREMIAGVSEPAGQPVDLSCTGSRTGETIVSSDPPAVIGLGHPPGDAPTTVLAQRVVEGSAEAVPLVVAREPIPGLTLVVPASGDAFPPGVYRLTAWTGDEARDRTFCAGVSDLD